MIKLEDYKNLVRMATQMDAGTAWHKIGETKDGRTIALVLGWAEGYAEDSNYYQEHYKGTIYTLAGKIAYNCDDLQCDFDYDWNLFTDKECGELYDDMMAISVDSDSTDEEWNSELEYWNDEAKAMLDLYNRGVAIL